MCSRETDAIKRVVFVQHRNKQDDIMLMKHMKHTT